MEKRVLLAGIASTIFLAVYAQITGLSMGAGRPVREGPVPDVAPAAVRAGIELSGTLAEVPEEETVEIESEWVAVLIGRRSGAIREVVLKKYAAGVGDGAVRVGGKLAVFQINGAGDDGWEFVGGAGGAAEFALAETGSAARLRYVIRKGEPVVDVFLHSDGQHGAGGRAVSGATVVWWRDGGLGNGSNVLEFVSAIETPGGKVKETRGGPPSRVRDVPRGTSFLTLAERYFCVIIKPGSGEADAVILPSPKGTIAANIQPSGAVSGEHVPWATLYFGPRDFFSLSRAGFKSALHLGVIGKIGLALLVVLGWVSGIAGNYGVGIVLFSALVSIGTAPFTLMSVRSMKKMRELQPKIDKITKQHKDDPKQTQHELMALYKEHRVSPLSGCLPMLLQLPIFIAMFQAISHFIELRGRSFLWIRDLSMPDRALQLGGFEINLLPIVMTGAMYLQSKISAKSMPTTDSNPMAAMMSGPLISVVFGVMFYQVPSGLVLYWLTNTAMQVLLFKVAK